jgi:hypothetical protein
VGEEAGSARGDFKVDTVSMGYMNRVLSGSVVLYDIIRSEGDCFIDKEAFERTA